MVANRSLPRVAVVVLTWNGLDDVVGCLESVPVLTYPNYGVIVVDNGSQDGTVEVVRKRFPWVTLLANDRNLGYAAGNNTGIRWALANGADHVFILNNDTKMTPAVLDRLVEVLESDRSVAIAGAKNLLMENPEYTWSRYGRLTWGPMLGRVAGRFEKDRSEDRSPKDVDWVVGNGCLMRRDALERVGLFDEAFFAYHEDVDWCVRARKAGYRVAYVDRAAIYHKGAATGGRRGTISVSSGYLLGRNAMLFARKHATWMQWGKLLSLMILGVVLRIILRAVSDSIATVRSQIPYLHGVVDGFRDRLQAVTVRRNGAGGGPVLRSTPIDRLARWLGG